MPISDRNGSKSLEPLHNGCNVSDRSQNLDDCLGVESVCLRARTVITSISPWAQRSHELLAAINYELTRYEDTEKVISSNIRGVVTCPS